MAETYIIEKAEYRILAGTVHNTIVLKKYDDVTKVTKVIGTIDGLATENSSNRLITPMGSEITGEKIKAYYTAGNSSEMLSVEYLSKITGLSKDVEIFTPKFFDKNKNDIGSWNERVPIPYLYKDTQTTQTLFSGTKADFEIAITAALRAADGINARNINYELPTSSVFSPTQNSNLVFSTLLYKMFTATGGRGFVSKTPLEDTASIWAPGSTSDPKKIFKTMVDSYGYMSDDTMISMADGTQKLLKNVQVGDSVVSYNKDGSKTTSRVKGINLGDGTVMTVYKIQLPNGVLQVTGDYQVYQGNGQYVALEELLNGSNSKNINLINKDNQSIFASVTKVGEQSTLNYKSLDVSGASTFDANGIVTHNHGTFLSETSDNIAVYLKNNFGDNVVTRSLGDGTSEVFGVIDAVYQPIKNVLQKIDDALSFTQQTFGDFFGNASNYLQQYSANIIADLILGKKIEDVAKQYALQIGAQMSADQLIKLGGGDPRASTFADGGAGAAIKSAIIQFAVVSVLNGKNMRADDYAKLAANASLAAGIRYAVLSAGSPEAWVKIPAVNHLIADNLLTKDAAGKVSGLTPVGAGAVSAAITVAANLFDHGFDHFDKTLEQAGIAFTAATAGAYATELVVSELTSATAAAVGTGAVGAEAGATIGSVVPGIGTVVGLVVGALLGKFLGDIFGGKAASVNGYATITFKNGKYTTHTDALDGGSAEPMRTFMQAVADAENSLIAATGQQVSGAFNTEWRYKWDDKTLAEWLNPVGTNTNVSSFTETKISLISGNAEWQGRLMSLMSKVAHGLQFVDADVFIDKALAAPTDDIRVMGDNVTVAQRYVAYLQNKDAIDVLLQAVPNSLEARTWTAVIGQAKAIGLDAIVDMTFKGSYARADNDALHGLAGNDTLWGYGGNDTLAGNAGNDLIYGGADNDALIGGDGNDTLIGGAGNNTLTSGAGADEFRFLQSRGAAQITDFDASDKLLLRGGEFGFGNLAAWRANAVQEGADTVFTDLSGNRIVLKNFNKDALRADQLGFMITGTSGSDVLVGSDGDDFINSGGSGRLAVDAQGNFYIAGGDTLIGNDGNDTLIGGGGNDLLLGGAGNDSLYGGRGNDTLFGGPGNDTLNGGAGRDYLDGGPGADVVSYRDAKTPVYSLYWPYGIIGYTGIKLALPPLNSIKVTKGPIQTQKVSIATYVKGKVVIKTFTINLTPGTLGRLGAAAGDTIVNIEGIEGTQYNDTLYGNEVNNILIGLNGNDLLYGSAADDILNGGIGTDTLVGGDGFDVASYRDATGGLTASLIATTVTKGKTTALIYAENTGEAAGDYYDGIEGLQGSQFGDLLRGNGYNNALWGIAGNDTLGGYGGNDTLYGGAGEDQLFGDQDNDMLYGGDGYDTLIGGAGNDTLAGEAGNDTLWGELGDDVLSGGAGEDLVVGQEGNDVQYGNDGNDTLAGWIGNDTLYGGAGEDQLYGDQDNDALYGGDGHDAVNGQAGNDTLAGEAGNDTLWGELGDDILSGGANEDLLYGQEGSDMLAGNEGNDTIYGWIGNDTLYGGAGEDQLYGDQDNDALYGGDGYDIIDGADGNDTLAGENGNDTLYGGIGDDQMSGGAGDDVLYADVGNDQVSGNDGNDTFYGFFGNDTLYGGAGEDQLYGEQDNDALYGGDGYDIIDGADGNDTLAGENGNDTLYGGIGDDQMSGGAGDDVLYADVGNDQVSGNDGNDTFYGFFGNDTLYGGADHDALYGEQDNDVLYGEDGNDSLYGQTGADSLDGGEGDDRLFGGTENDTLSGGNGYDELHGDEGNDLLAGGAGDDTLYGGVDDDTLNGEIGNDSLAGEDGNDSLDGGEGVNILSGGGGNDTLVGGVSADTLIGGAGDDVFYVNGDGNIVIEADNEGLDTVLASITAYTLGYNVENLTYVGGTLFYGFAGTGNALNNVLTGGDGNDTLAGGGGNDTLIGGAGDDVYIVDALGDAITDTAGTDEVRTALAAYTLGVKVENLRYTGGGTFSGTGNELNNVLTGGIYADTLTGGAGNDTYIADSNDLIVESLGAGIDEVRVNATSYTLGINLENLTYIGSAATSLLGNDLNNVMTGALYADTLNGGIGNDTLLGNTGDDVLYGMDGNDQLEGGAGSDRLEGGNGSNTLLGGAGNDTLVSSSATDTLNGDAGDDVYILYAGSGTVTEAADAGTDEIRTTLASYTLGANLENLTYIGSGNFSGTGNGLNNVLTGGAGADTLAGGLGNDVYYVTSGDVITENLNAGTDEIRTALASYTLGANLENLTYTGTLAFTATGNALNNVLTGGSGADTLAGGLGDDIYTVGVGDVVTEALNAGTDEVRTALTSYTLGANLENLTYTGAVAFNGNGNDLNNVLTGGVGADTLAGGLGNDIYYATSGDVITESLNAGTDEIRTALASYTLGTNLENLTYTGTAAFTGNGNDLNNVLTGGSGSDTLSGGLGNDIYYATSGDVITENLNAGTDEIRTALASYTLGANVENLTYTGAVAFTGNGNALSNVLTGGINNDTLFGGAGADTLTGGAGNDQLDGGLNDDLLTGGAGADTFVFNINSFGHDVITDYGNADYIKIIGATADDLQALLGSRRQVGANTVFTGRNGDTLTLNGVTASSIDVARFSYAA